MENEQDKQVEQPELESEQAEATDNETHDQVAATEESVSEPDSEAGADASDWHLEKAKLNEQIESLKDQALRVQAEMQNVRRRAELDVEKAHKFGMEKFVKELLPVIDTLDKAIEAERASNEQAASSLLEGVDMTLSMFLTAANKFGIEQVDPIGKPFDPALHEAMSMIESPDAEPNTVIAAMQKGYTLNGRLIRPAMVVVSKGGGKVDETV